MAAVAHHGWVHEEDDPEKNAYLCLAEVHGRSIGVVALRPSANPCLADRNPEGSVLAAVCQEDRSLSVSRRGRYRVPCSPARLPAGSTSHDCRVHEVHEDLGDRECHGYPCSLVNHEEHLGVSLGAGALVYHGEADWAFQE